jgi:hypothetical protein
MEWSCTMSTVVLLGDSIFDNANYVPRGEAVIDKLRPHLPLGFNATLLARDGAVIDGIRTQLQQLPADASHLVISAGGNDALRSTSVLMERASSVADALSRIAVVRDGFAERYRLLLDDAAGTGLPTAACTIYDAQLPDGVQRGLANLALGVLNDVITREAVRRRLPVIDLRVLFDDPADYANAIEPSGQGSGKIAHAIAKILAAHDFDGPTVMYTRVA